MIPYTYLALGKISGINPYQLLSPKHFLVILSAKSGFGLSNFDIANRIEWSVIRLERTPSRISEQSSSHTFSKVLNAWTMLWANEENTNWTSSQYTRPQRRWQYKDWWKSGPKITSLGLQHWDWSAFIVFLNWGVPKTLVVAVPALRPPFVLNCLLL